MKTKTTIISLLLLAALLVMLFAGCGKTEDPLTVNTDELAFSGKTTETTKNTTTETDPIRLFDFDLSEYIDLRDPRSLSLTQKEINDQVAEYLTQLRENYPVTYEKTEGTIENGDITSIFYRGVLIINDGSVTFKRGQSGIPGLDDAVTAGEATLDLNLPEEFVLPEYLKRENELLEEELAGKHVTIRLSDYPEALPGEGEDLTLSLRFEYVFSGGTYDENTNGGKGYNLEIGSNSFIPGFEEGMIGMSVLPATQKTIPLAFPDPYKNNYAFSGEKAEFTVTIVSVTGVHICDLEDPEDFAAFKANYEEELGSGSFDYDDLSGIVADYGKRARADLGYTHITSDITVKKEHEELLEEYKALVKSQVITRYSSYYYSLIGRMLTEEEIISYFFGGDRAQYEEQIAEAAENYLHTHMMCFGAARMLALDEVTNAEVDSFLEEEAQSYVAQGYTVTAEDVLTQVYGTKNEVVKEIVVGRLVDWFTDNIKVTE